MGRPYFEMKGLLTQHGAAVFSSNYVLYTDMSRRVMAVLKELGIRQEVISVDESFLDLTGIPDLTKYGNKICKTVKQYTGLPVCVGIGQTKVLAKFANNLAKKYKFLAGVCNLDGLGFERVEKAMKITPVEDVWGVGRQLCKQLKLMNITTVYDLKMANPKQLSSIFSINVEKIVYELNGIQCLELEEYQGNGHQILSSHSFGQAVTSIDDLISSVMNHLEAASKKLRKQGVYARQLTVFINNNRFNDSYYYNSSMIELPHAMDSFRLMAKYIEPLIKRIYKTGIAYKKSGIVLSSLISSQYDKKDLFDVLSIEHDSVLETLEQIKQKYGRSAIKIASRDLSNNWHMQRNNMSKHYTTDLDQLLQVG